MGLTLKKVCVLTKTFHLYPNNSWKVPLFDPGLWMDQPSEVVMLFVESLQPWVLQTKKRLIWRSQIPRKQNRQKSSDKSQHARQCCMVSWKTQTSMKICHGKDCYPSELKNTYTILLFNMAGNQRQLPSLSPYPSRWRWLNSFWETYGSVAPTPLEPWTRTANLGHLNKLEQPAMFWPWPTRSNRFASENAVKDTLQRRPKLGG